MGGMVKRLQNSAEVKSQEGVADIYEDETKGKSTMLTAGAWLQVLGCKSKFRSHLGVVEVSSFPLLPQHVSKIDCLWPVRPKMRRASLLSC